MEPKELTEMIQENLVDQIQFGLKIDLFLTLRLKRNSKLKHHMADGSFAYTIIIAKMAFSDFT